MKMIAKLSLAISILLTLCTATFAQPRSEGDALEIARQYLLQQKATATNRAPSAQPLQLSVVAPSAVEKKTANRAAASGQAAGFYIVNDESNERFVIVSGDSRQTAILGYSEHNTFDVDNIPCGLEMMLAQYNQEFDYLQQHVNGITRDVPVSTSRRAPNVSPLVSTEWDQGNNDPGAVGEYVFNKFCPTDPSTNKKSLTGCVATAMAQILNVHKQPSSLPSKTVNYTTSGNNIKLSKTMSNYPLNWSSMRDIYRDKYGSYATTAAQRDAVGYLMFACGLAVHMNYKSSGSGASDNNVPYALNQYFGYNDNVHYCERSYYAEDEWNGMIQDELQAGRPVLYGGTNPNTNGGHAFIIDGCKSDGTYHINWGWNGSGNGYFVLSTLSSENYYVSDQDMVIGISPNTVGTKTEQFYADAFSMTATSINIGSSTTGRISKPTCQSTPDGTTGSYDGAKWSGAIGIAVFDTDFNPIKEYACKINGSTTLDYTLGMYWTNPLSVTVTFDSNTFQNGKEYYIAPYAKGANSSTATRMRTLNAASDYYLATVADGKVTLTLMGTPNGGGGGGQGGGGGGGDTPQTGTPQLQYASVSATNSDLSNLTNNDVLKVNASFNNIGQTASIRTRLIIRDGNAKTQGSVEDTRTFQANTTTSISYEYALTSLPAGSYTADVQFHNNWGTTEEQGWYHNTNYILNFTVTNSSTPVTSVSASPFSITLNPGVTRQLTATVRPDDATDKSVTWTSSNTSVATVSSSGLVTAVAAGEATITCTANDGSGKSSTVAVQVLASGLPSISQVSLTTTNSNTGNMKPGDKLNLRATFKNTGTAAKLYTAVVIPNSAGTQVLYSGERIVKQFPVSSSITYDYEFTLPNDIPEGSYKAYVMYWKNWDGNNTWTYNKNYVIDITVGTNSNPVISTTSATINNTNPQSLTQNDQLSLTTVYKNSGASISEFMTAAILFKNGEWYGRSEINTSSFSANETKTVTHSFTLNNIVFENGKGPVEPGSYKVAIMYWDSWDRNSWIYKDSSVLFDITVTSGTPVDAVFTDGDDEESAVYYDLRGRRIDKPTQKGIYIRNGKKIIIK